MRAVCASISTDCADDVALVLIPDARRSKQDAGTGWQTRLVEPPAAQLPPIHLIDIRVGRGHRYVVGSLSAKHAKRERGNGLHLGQLIATTAADDARLNGGIRPTVGRRVGRRRDAGEVGHLLHVLAGTVLAHGPRRTRPSVGAMFSVALRAPSSPGPRNR